LVFGVGPRGVAIPLLTPSFETTVPGIFIAGELGGMGLIRNALEQGRQAVEVIRSRGKASGDMLDLLIVGAGPAGFSASLTAMAHGMRFATIEQESLGGCVFQYPRGKLVMTAPATVPLVGKINFRQTSKEALLEFWKEAERKTGVKINYRERVEDITRESGGFAVKSSPRAISRAQCTARDRAAGYTAQAERAGRGAPQGRLSSDRPGAVCGTTRTG